MPNKLFLFALLLLAGQKLSAQAFDTTVYRHLLTAGKDEFISYANSKGLSTTIDTAAEILFAKTIGCLYGRPLGTKNNNQYYDLVMIVSTQDKNNNKLVLANATESDKKGVWTDSQYLYYEFDMQNPISNQMWYKILIYKKKT